MPFPDKDRRATSLPTHLLNLVAFTILLYALSDIPLYTATNFSYCDCYRQLKILYTTCNHFTVYFILWYRVYKLFYRNPVLNQSTSRFTRWCAHLTIPWVFAMALTIAIVFFSSNTYVKSEKFFGCERTNTIEKESLRWSMFLIATVSCQMLILFILVHPLYLHKKNLLDQGIETKKVIPLIKRAVLMAIICIVTDTAQTMFSIVYQNRNIFVRHVIYGTNIWINFLAVIFSFSDWKLRMFPNKLKQHLNAISQQKKNSTMQNRFKTGP